MYIFKYFEPQLKIPLYYTVLVLNFLLPVQTLKVAIIGGGASGLTSLKWCLEAGFSVDLFEQTGSIGGVWNYSNYTTDVDDNGLPVYSVIYENVTTNLPKDLMAFSDFPYPDVPPSFIPSERVMQYLSDYANHFNLLPHIQFYKQVVKVNPLRENEWTLTVRNAKTNLTDKLEYDAVMICYGGNYFKQFVPNIPGMKSFKGKQLHSKTYRSPEEFKGQKVLVVGAGPSGVDISNQLSVVAQKVILSKKYPIPHYLKLSDGVTDLKPLIESIHGRTVKFNDNTQENVDAIIYCTGFRYDMPFLTEACDIREENRWIKYLYKHIINVKHLTMGIIGIVRLYIPFPVNELQAKFFIAHLKNSFTLPSEEKMMTDIMDHLDHIRQKNWSEKDFHVLLLEQDSYCKDLANIANITSLPPYIYKMMLYILSPEFRNARKDYYRIIDNENFAIV